MSAKATNWSSAECDYPIPLLTRRRVEGKNILVARVRLEAGCYVAPHRHESEQIAVILSGRVRWTTGEPGSEEEREMAGGDVMVLPSNVPHSVLAIEETEVLDILSPPGPMGVDSQGG